MRPDSAVEQPDQVSAVTTLELFFDLVLVFTLTQLSRLLSEELNVVGAFRVTLILAALLAFMSIPVGTVLPAWAHVLLLAGLAVADSPRTASHRELS